MDYLFAQAGARQRSSGHQPKCGNMLADVGPFAIEQGLMPAADGMATVRVYNVNAGVEMHGLTHDGSALALRNTVDGHTQLMFASLFSAQPRITSGRLRGFGAQSGGGEGVAPRTSPAERPHDTCAAAP